MKNFLQSVALLFVLLFGVQTNAHANPYPDHLNGDPDYALTFARQGMAYYVKKSSLNVEKYAPPIYVLSVEVYIANNPGREENVSAQPMGRRFLYEWDKREMYLDAGKDWNYLDPKYYSSNTSIGEMAFYIAYKEKFYGYNDGFYRSAD